MKKIILNILKNAMMPIKRRQLLYQLLSLGYETTDREMRSVIEELVREGELIESSERGYALIKTEDDLKRAFIYLRKKALAIFSRASIIHKNYYRNNNKQLTFEEFFTER